MPSVPSALSTEISLHDEIDDKVAWLSEARRYYTNIVGKFGMSVQGLLKKAAGLEIR